MTTPPTGATRAAGPMRRERREKREGVLSFLFPPVPDLFPPPPPFVPVLFPLLLQAPDPALCC